MTELTQKTIRQLFIDLMKAKKYIGYYDAGEEAGMLVIALVPPEIQEVIQLLDSLEDVVLMNKGVDPRCEHDMRPMPIHSTGTIDELFDQALISGGTMTMTEPIKMITKSGREVPAITYMSVHPPHHRDALNDFFTGRAKELQLGVVKL